MNTTTKNILCYGIEINNAPWRKEKYLNDIDEWWIYEVNKYKEIFPIYTKDEDYIDGITQSQINEWNEHKRIFEENMPPIPIELVHYNIGYEKETKFIIAVKGSVIESKTPIKSENKITITEEQKKIVMDFSQNYCSNNEEPKWISCSYTY